MKNRKLEIEMKISLLETRGRRIIWNQKLESMTYGASYVRGYKMQAQIAYTDTKEKLKKSSR
jgi:hypothetical protein